MIQDYITSLRKMVLNNDEPDKAVNSDGGRQAIPKVPGGQDKEVSHADEKKADDERSGSKTDTKSKDDAGAKPAKKHLKGRPLKAQKKIYVSDLVSEPPEPVQDAGDGQHATGSKTGWAPPGNKGTNSEEVAMKFEKIEGKFESVNEAKNQLLQKMVDAFERIGEIRSMVLERERRINDIELKSERISDIVSELDPKKLIQKMEKINSKFTEVDASIEKNMATISTLKSEVSRLNEKTSKIGDFKPLSDMHIELARVMKEVDSRRKEIFVLSSKIESMFGELSSRFPELDTLKSKIDSYSETFHDALRDIDKLKVQMNALNSLSNVSKEISGLAPKDYVASLNVKTENNIRDSNARIDELFYKLNDISKHITDLAAPSGDRKKALEDIKKINDRMAAFEAEMQRIRQIEDVGSDISGVLAEYEKINDAWKWGADKQLKDFQNNMKLLSDKFHVMNKDTQKIMHAMDQVEELKSRDCAIEDFEARLSALASRLNAMDGRVSIIAQNVDAKSSEMHRLSERESINALNPAIVAYFKELEERLLLLSERVDRLNGEVAMSPRAQISGNIKSSTALAQPGTLMQAEAIPDGVLDGDQFAETDFPEPDTIEAATNEIESAFSDAEKAENLIERQEFEEASKLCRRALNTYLTLVSTETKNSALRIRLLGLYERLKKIQGRLKNA